MSKQTFVVVGASLAGAKAAQELRDHGFDGELILIGAETDRPYERPPLSKDYLRGESEREKAYVHPADFYGAQSIELLTETTVTAIDVNGSRVTLDDGRELAGAEHDFNLRGRLVLVEVSDDLLHRAEPLAGLLRSLSRLLGAVSGVDGVGVGFVGLGAGQANAFL